MLDWLFCLPCWILWFGPLAILVVVGVWAGGRKLAKLMR